MSPVGNLNPGCKNSAFGFKEVWDYILKLKSYNLKDQHGFINETSLFGAIIACTFFTVYEIEKQVK